MPLILCLTTDATGEYDAAVLDLTPKYAQILLAYRPLTVAASDYNLNFYALEYFDRAADFGCLLDSDFGCDLDEGGWLSVPVRETPVHLEDLIEPAEVMAETLVVTRNGVLWSASDKYSDAYFETPEIAWEAIEAVARGEDPFPTAENVTSEIAGPAEPEK